MRACVPILPLVALVSCAIVGEKGRDGTVNDAAAPKGRAVLIVADEWKQLEPLAEFLRTEGDFDVRRIDQKDLGEGLSAYHAVFMYIHGPFNTAAEKALIDYATGGGRLVVLHHGIASARVRNPDWLRMAGIAIAPRDDPKRPWRVIAQTTHTLVNLQPNHYITSHKVTYDRTVEYASSDCPGAPAKLPAIDLPNTEVFINQQFTDGQEKTVLFGSTCTDPQTGRTVMQDRGGWYKPAGRGRLFYLQPGHAESDFRNRNYCQIILNCLTWEGPAKGPSAR